MAMPAKGKYMESLDLVIEEDEIFIEIDAAGNYTPEKHDKAIIIDADTIAFAACSVCQYEAVDISPDREHAVYDESLGCFRDINIDEAVLHAKGKVELILERIGGKKKNTELHFTMSRDNFRNQLLKEAFPNNPELWYKAHRSDREKKPPVGLSACKEQLAIHFKSFYWLNIEADDAVVERKYALKDNAILVCVDKDIYKNTPDFGQPHWNYYEAPWLANPIAMKWIPMDEEEALYNLYMQAIIGDRSDNVPGLPGIGPKKAAAFLELGMSEEELWEGVKAAYNKHCKYGDPEQMAILNMRLVNMNQTTDGEVSLWQPMES